MVTIVTDSSVDLPRAEAERLGVVIAPLSVAFSDENLHDSGLDRGEFYRRLAAAPRPPLVSGAAAEAFVSAFREAQPRGEIVCMVMSVESSFTYVAVEVAVREVAGLAISVINTGRSLAAQAAIVIAAAEAAQAGASRAAIVALIEALSGRADTYLAPATTEYLRRADRLTTLGQGPAGRLDGAIPVLRVRGRLTAVAKAPDAAAARAQMLALVVKAIDPADEQIVVVTHAVAPAEAVAVAQELVKRIRCRPPLITELGPTVGTFLGPGTVGVGFCPASAPA